VRGTAGHSDGLPGGVAGAGAARDVARPERLELDALIDTLDPRGRRTSSRPCPPRRGRGRRAVADRREVPASQRLHRPRRCGSSSALAAWRTLRPGLRAPAVRFRAATAARSTSVRPSAPCSALAWSAAVAVGVRPIGAW
jgi:hypothetical protein